MITSFFLLFRCIQDDCHENMSQCPRCYLERRDLGARRRRGKTAGKGRTVQGRSHGPRGAVALHARAVLPAAAAVERLLDIAPRPYVPQLTPANSAPAVPHWHVHASLRPLHLHLQAAITRPSALDTARSVHVDPESPRASATATAAGRGRWTHGTPEHTTTSNAALCRPK